MKTFAEEFIPMISSREKVWTVFLLCVCLVSMFAECWVVFVSVGVSAFPRHGPARFRCHQNWESSISHRRNFSPVEKGKNPIAAVNPAGVPALWFGLSKQSVFRAKPGPRSGGFWRRARVERCGGGGCLSH